MLQQTFVGNITDITVAVVVECVTAHEHRQQNRDHQRRHCHVCIFVMHSAHAHE